MTKPQLAALHELARGTNSAYGMQVSYGVLRALQRRGLARPMQEPTHLTRRTVRWYITTKGRVELERALV